MKKKKIGKDICTYRLRAHENFGIEGITEIEYQRTKFPSKILEFIWFLAAVVHRILEKQKERLNEQVKAIQNNAVTKSAICEHITYNDGHFIRIDGGRKVNFSSA